MVLSGVMAASILFPHAASAQPGVSSGGAFGGGLGGNTVTAGANYISAPTGGGVSAAAPGTPTSGGGGGAASGPALTYGQTADPAITAVRNAETGELVAMNMINEETGAPTTCPITSPGECFAMPDTGVPPTPVSLADVMNVVSSAVAALQVEPIDIGITPQPASTGAVGTVGFNSWLWVNNPSERTVGPVNRTVTSGVITVNLNAVNTGLAVNYGDGLPTIPPVCPVSSIPYTDAALDLPSPTCNHFLQKSSQGSGSGSDQFAVSVSSLWLVSWSAVTPGQVFGGTIPITPTATTEVRVGEMQVLVTK